MKPRNYVHHFSCAPFRIACPFYGKFIGFGKLYVMRIIRTLTVGFLMVLALNSASAETAAKAKKFDWRPVMDAITQVESKGNAKAVNGPHAGILQISHHVVAECNNILKAKGSKKRYTMADRFSPEKSREMFILFQSKYNKANNAERAIRMWHGGINFSKSKTQQYYNKVKRFLRN